eukprot:scaffold1151_cov126-Isochrysis_galbana.AAC.7
MTGRAGDANRPTRWRGKWPGYGKRATSVDGNRPMRGTRQARTAEGGVHAELGSERGRRYASSCEK